MYRFFLAAFFILSIFNVFSIEPEEEVNISEMAITLSAECEPLTTIADCVNLVSGRFFQVDKDLVGNTIDPLQLIRFYDSGSQQESFLGFGFASQFALLASHIQKRNGIHYGVIAEREGFLMPYQGSNPSSIPKCHIDPRVLQQGYTNLNKGAMGGQTNWINWKAVFKSNEKRGFWKVIKGDGTKRIYSRLVRLDPYYRSTLQIPTKDAFLLTKEVKPNGNEVLFSYKTVEGLPFLAKVQTLNRTGTAVLNELNFVYSQEGCSVKSSCGHYVNYAQKTLLSGYILFGSPIEPKRKILKAVFSNQNGAMAYQNIDDFSYPFMTRINKPHNQFREIEYHSDRKVKCIKEPIGINSELIPTYRFHYDPSQTKVWDALGQLSTYHFDSAHRLSRIDYFDHDKIVRQDVFKWSHESNQPGWLATKSIRLGSQIYYLKSYLYDEKGNVIRQTVYGNLTGEKPKSFTLNEKPSTDQYSIDYEYSREGRNLLLRMSTPQGLSVFYDYLPGTNLCTKELEHYQGRIQERIFRLYDDNGQIQQIIEDNGSGKEESDWKDVTYRIVKTIYAEMNPSVPSFGKPRQIVETILDQDTGKMVVLKTTNLFYDSHGNEIKQRVFDSKTNFAMKRREFTMNVKD